MDKCESAAQARSLSRDYSCLSRGGCADGRVELSIFILFFSLSLHSVLGHHRLDTPNLTVSPTDAAKKLPTFTACPSTSVQSWQILEPLLLLTQPLSRVHCDWHLHAIQILHVIIQVGATTVQRIIFSPDAKKVNSCTMGFFCYTLLN